jgi:hypothetical protein
MVDVLTFDVYGLYGHALCIYDVTHHLTIFKI